MLSLVVQYVSHNLKAECKALSESYLGLANLVGCSQDYYM